jgi:Domain of unknown function (DUF5134)
VAGTPVLLRWALSVAFAATGGYCLVRCTGTGHRRVDRVDDLAQAVMATIMIAMLWAWDRGDPWGIQSSVFAVASGWFAVRAVAGGVRSAGRLGTADGRDRGLWHQSVVMGAMVWMLLCMPPAPGGGSPAGGAMPTMAGMGDRPGFTVAGFDLITVAAAVYLIAAAPWWLWQWRTALSPARGPATPGCTDRLGCTDRPSGTGSAAGLIAAADPACQALMSVAMGAALLMMR